MTAPTTALVFLSEHFGYTACGLVIFNFRCVLPLQYLFRFEQIPHCGIATNTCASREVDSKRWEAVQHDGRGSEGIFARDFFRVR
jgi:hypothetical protein